MNLLRHGRSLLIPSVSGLVFAVVAFLCADLIQAPSFFLKSRKRSEWSPLAGLFSDAHHAGLRSRNHSRFEAGNISSVRRVGRNKIVMSLRSDNDDALPKFWRQWWYAALDGISRKNVTDVTLKGAGQWNKYIPVYSYDNETWQHFSPSEVSRPDKLTLRIRKKFASDKVWLARFHPYTYSDLLAYQEKLKQSRYVEISSLGDSSEGRDIPVWTITNPAVRAASKSRVVIHARTHPGELASSYLLEGLVNYLLSRDSGAQRLRNRLIFEIVPMLNPDGVVAGNNRVTTYGVNLEGKWYARTSNPFLLDLERVPHEVRLFYRKIRNVLEERAPVTMALNLHSSAGEPEDGVFFFPHFGPGTLGYNKEEAGLWDKQMRFINAFVEMHGKSWFNPPPKDGTRSFVKKSVPESWWWQNFRDKVMAISIETTYGLAGDCNRWMTPDDLKVLGASLAKSIGSYHNLGRFSKARIDNCRKK
jgi:hypothetical protein